MTHTSTDYKLEQFRAARDALHKICGIRVAYRDDSKFVWRLLGKLLFFNRNFSTKFTIVVGKTAYFPSREWLVKNPGEASIILAHEAIHILDMRRLGTVPFVLGYFFPQWLAVFALLAIWLGPMALLPLLCLGPWPAPFRWRWEARGYAVQTSYIARGFPAVPDVARRLARDHFVSWKYWRMSWDPYGPESHIRKWSGVMLRTAGGWESIYDNNAKHASIRAVASILARLDILPHGRAPW